MQNEKPVFYLLLSQRPTTDSVPTVRKVSKVNAFNTTPLLWEQSLLDESEILPGMPNIRVRNLVVCLCLN